MMLMHANPYVNLVNGALAMVVLFIAFHWLRFYILTEWHYDITINRFKSFSIVNIESHKHGGFYRRNHKEDKWFKLHWKEDKKGYELELIMDKRLVKWLNRAYSAHVNRNSV